MTIIAPSRRQADARGFSLVELLITMAITLVIMGATMTALGDAWKATESTSLVTGLNSGLRVAMDLMVRDLLQVGQGLPTGRNITIPSGGDMVRLPGPPETDILLPATTTQLTAVIPGPGQGPTVNGRKTDIITTLAADSSFEGVALTALTDTTMTVARDRPRQPLTGNPVVRNAITNGADIVTDANANDDGEENDIDKGDLIMLTRGSLSALVEVTDVSNQVITFASGGSLNLNQTAAAEGTVREYRDTDPTAAVLNEALSEPAGTIQSVATRIRMITYYIDATTDPARPRLVRRMNNRTCSVSDPECTATLFDNNFGTAVAFDVENLEITYDLADGAANPTKVAMTDDDMDPEGPPGKAEGCPCDPERIRKVNVLLSARAPRVTRVTQQLFRNSLYTQVSLRSLAFVDKYQ
jgi:prepilin-type N-terminal cleavage/methylation domain-containing protein